MSSPDFHFVEEPNLGQISCSLQVDVNDPAGRGYSPLGGMGFMLNEFASPEATLDSVLLDTCSYDEEQEEQEQGADGSGVAFARGSITFRPAAMLRARQSQEAKMIGMMGAYKQTPELELRELSQQSKYVPSPKLSVMLETPFTDVSYLAGSSKLSTPTTSLLSPGATV